MFHRQVDVSDKIQMNCIIKKKNIHLYQSNMDVVQCLLLWYD